MNSFKLALFNAKNNIKIFKLNIICMVFSIAVFFNFFSLIFNPSLDLAKSDKLLIKATLYMVSMLLVFFILFFILYSNSFFLKQRKKEIGIYTFMGVDNSKIGVAFAIEVVILGVISLILGLLSGMIFQKAFLMLLTKIASMDRVVTFYLSVNAIIITTVVFILIFSISALRGFMTILKSKLIDLLNAEKQEDKILKTRYLTGILSIVLIVIGYLYSRNIFTDTFVIDATIVIFCIILGTFLLFSSFLSLVIKFMINNKKILYDETNIISISNVAYRIRYNYRTLACITIIVAATITSIGATFSIQHLLKSTTKLTYPYSFSYVKGDSTLDEKVMDTINNSKHKVLLDIKTKYLIFNSQKNIEINKNYPVIKHSDFNKIITSLKVSNLNTIINSTKTLADGNAITVASSNDSGFKDNQALDLYGLNVKVKKTINAPLLGGRFENNTIVLTDNDYNKFKSNCYQLEQSEVEQIFQGILVSDQDNSLELSKQLSVIPELKENLNSYITYYTSYNELTGVVKFTGLFLGLVFMLSTASIMYMKIMSDAIADKKKYEILMKLGINESELYGAVSKQVGLSYILPILVGAMHSFVAIMVLQNFLNKYLEISLVLPYLFSLIIYVIVYILFYLLTTRKFIKLVTA
ncbi:MAG: ABC transporter permease [Clostridiaceae bacterium]|nr:ABC transporter permease [Clostridiaceae bacterium]